MKKKTKGDALPTFIKVIYFDEPTTQDYIDIVNGGRLDWSKEENKERAAKILTEIEARAESGINILNFIKASFSGSMGSNISGEISKMLDTTLKNTLLTGYISEAFQNNNARKFENDGVYAPENSVSMYKMYSSYLIIVPKEQLPIDMEKLSDRVEIEYDYAMIQKMLLKYAYNDMRSHKEDCSFFDEEIKQFLMNSDETIPKENITILCGIAVNVSLFPMLCLEILNYVGVKIHFSTQTVR